jgi:hypothetical protein
MTSESLRQCTLLIWQLLHCLDACVCTTFVTRGSGQVAVAVAAPTLSLSHLFTLIADLSQYHHNCCNSNLNSQFTFLSPRMAFIDRADTLSDAEKGQVRVQLVKTRLFVHCQRCRLAQG